jgi:uncharacterized protein (TIGR02266 family)
MADGRGDEPPDYVVLRSERRKGLRKQLLVLSIKGKGGNGVFFGYAKTLSPGGMFISSVNPQKAGSEFEIAFRLPGDATEVRCRCAVVWCREYAPQSRYEPGMGIRFLDIAPEAKARIEEWVRKG